MIEVINIRNCPSFNPETNPNDVYIGRWSSSKHGLFLESKWANPFKEGRDGTREEVISKYRKHLLNRPDLMAALPELVGKRLGCWCIPNACHGNILKDLVEELGVMA